MTDADILEGMIQPETKETKVDLDVLKELFTGKDVETKTELTAKQIVLVNQKRTLAKLLDWDSLDLTLNDFMLLMISHRRAGRGEFVEGFKSEREQKTGETQKGFFNNLQNRLKW